MIERCSQVPAWPPAGGLARLAGPGLAQAWFLASLAAGAVALGSGHWGIALMCAGPALIWGALNDFEPTPPAWYGEKHHPGRPGSVVLAAWYLRNPFQNAGRYGFGVSHRAFTVIGPAPALSTHPREDALHRGEDAARAPAWKWHVLWLGWAFPLPLPFVSYWSDRWKFYVGFQHNGFFGLKLNARFAAWNLW